MNLLKKTIPVLRIIVSIIVPTLLVATVVYASGSLTAPSGTPSATSYTLDDIYARLTTNAAASSGSHYLSTTTSPSASFRSLTEIYNAIPTISASKVTTGTTYLGVAGTVFANMFNGTCSNPDDSYTTCNWLSAVPGGSQSNGGVDDFNGFFIGGAAPSDRYATSWTTCTVGNNYCGTGDTGANAKDNATGIVWSYPCKGNGCSSWDTETSTTTLTTGCLPVGECAYFATDTLYTWNANGVDNNSLTAKELCSSHSGWSLPHQKQLLQAYINGSYGNLEPEGVYRYYWSATAVSFNTTLDRTWVWLINLSDGYSYDNREDRSRSIRCMR